MVKPKIACYITGGWTECGYLTRFLEKINGLYDYRQRFPQKNVGKKGKSRKILKVTGTTGSDLLRTVYEDLKQHKEELADYRAVLIEDDMDDRYFLDSKTGRDYEKIEERKREITSEIRNITENPNLHVFFLYAMPEIEGWFLADWDEAFGKEYMHVLKKMNPYFSITFRKYILTKVLTALWPFEEIENWGYVDSEYHKLSDQVIDAFQEYSYASEEYKNNTVFNKRINILIQKNEIQYSKKREGVNMLLRIRPEKVASICKHYFAQTYAEIRDFRDGVDNAYV